jgi:putative ABC transport system substrate-binding protein
MPSIAKVAVILNATDPFSVPFSDQTEDAAANLGIALLQYPTQPDTVEVSLADALREGAQAAILQPSLPRRAAADSAAKLRLAIISPIRPFAREGGLLAYAPNSEKLWRTAVPYIDRILRGAKPSDLPVQQPTEFELAVNVKTAKTLGIAIPPEVLARADEVIE